LTEYLLSPQGSRDLEQSRLRLLQEFHDPPSDPTSERTWSVFCDTLLPGGWDRRYGARLCDDMRAVGLVDLQADHVASLDAGGSLGARVLSLTFARLRERMVALGADREEIDEARRLLEDPGNTFSSPTTCVARARRPTA
jgi:hypothetical protein